MRAHRLLTVVALAAAVAAACGSAPPKPADPTLAKGYEIYDASCASCHGATGGGGAGPRLVGVGQRLSDEQIRQVVAEGRPGTAMPAWADRGLSPDDIAAVSAYVETLQG